MGHALSCRVFIRWMHAVVLIAALSGMVEARERNQAMNSSAAASIDRLSPDLVPFVSTADASILLLRIDAIESTLDVEDDLKLETGRITAKVEDKLSGPPSSDFVIQIPFKRVADPLIRVRQGFDQWNKLKIDRGSLIVMACRPSRPQGTWLGLAAQNISSINSPIVTAIREAVSIERTGGGEKKEAMLRGALGSREDLLFSYALNALGERSVLGRERGSEIVARAVESSSTNSENRLRMASDLTRDYFFDPVLKTERTNQVVLSALARAFVQEGGAESRLELLDDLAVVILGEFSGKKTEDEAIRHTLIRNLPTQLSERVISTLSLAKSHAEPDEQERVADLLHTWQRAMKAVR